MEERIDFIEELLLQAEQADQERKIEMDRLRADQILAAIGTLEEGMAGVNDLCDKELKLIEEYRTFMSPAGRQAHELLVRCIHAARLPRPACPGAPSTPPAPAHPACPARRRRASPHALRVGAG